MSMRVGTVIDRYTVVSELGSGGMAKVYLVRHSGLGTLHALKVLTVSSDTIRERLVQEGRIQGTLKHPNVVAVTDLLDVDGAPGLVMEYIEGPALDEFMAVHRFPLRQADWIARRIIAGVAAAHELRLVHRDLKPGNVMLQLVEGRLVPKVADFGLAKVLDTKATPVRTRSGMAMGTPAYMSPEQIRDASDVDHRADIFSLGAILYELASGQRAFSGANLLEIFENVGHGRHTPITEVAPDLPARMTRAIQTALVVDREERVQNCGDLLQIWADGTSLDEDAWDEGTLERARELSARPIEFQNRLQSTPAPSETYGLFSELDQEAETVPPPAETLPPSAPTTPTPPPQIAPRPAPSRRWLYVAMPVLLLSGALALGAAWTLQPDQIVVADFADIERIDGGFAGVGILAASDQPSTFWRQTTVGGRVTRLERRSPFGVDHHELSPPAVYRQNWEGDHLVQVEVLNGYGNVSHRMDLTATDDGVHIAHRNRADLPQRDPENAVFGEVHALDDDGRPTRVTYQSVGADPMRAKNGTWGRRIDRDELGRITRLSHLGPDMEDAMDTHGVAAIEHSYGSADSPYWSTSVRYRGFADVPVPDVFGCAERVFTHSLESERETEACFDASGDPFLERDSGCHVVERWNEESSSWMRCLGLRSEPLTASLGWTLLRTRVGGSGFVEEVAWMGPNGDPINGSHGYAKAVMRMDDGGNLMATGPYFDAAGEQVVGPSGIGSSLNRRDERGNITETSFSDLDGLPAIGPLGFAIQRMQYDELDRLVDERIFDGSSQAYLGPQGYHRQTTAYDELGAAAERRWFGANERPILNKDGVAGVRYKTDPRLMVQVDQRFYGVDDEPILRGRNNVARIKGTYNDRGQITRLDFFGLDDQPHPDLNGVMTWEFDVNPRGNILERRSIDPTTGALRLTKEGIAVERMIQDPHGNPTLMTWFGEDAKPVAGPISGCAKIESELDEFGRATVDKCFDITGKPTFFAADRGGVFHARHHSYDIHGRVVGERFAGVDGRPALNMVGFAYGEYEFDDRGNLIEERAYDVDQRLALNAEGWAVARYGWDERDHGVLKEYFGPEEEAVIVTGCRCHRELDSVDEAGRLLERRRVGVDGELVTNATARSTVSYDRRGRETERAHFDATGAPDVTHGYARLVTSWDLNGRPTETRYDANGTEVSP